MAKQKRLSTTIILWTLISFSFIAVVYLVSDLFRLETMVVQAEKRELERQFGNLGVILGGDAVLQSALDHASVARGNTRQTDIGLGAERRTTRAQSGLVPVAYSPPFRPADQGGVDLVRIPRAVVLNGGWDILSGLEPAAGHLAPFRSGPVLDDFKRKAGVDAALFGLGNGGLAPLAATLAGAAWLTDDELRRAAAGETILRERRLGDMEAAILAGPVHDPSGRPVGVAVVAHNRAEFTATVGAVRNAVIGIGLLLLFVGASIACAVSAKPAEA